LWGCSPESRCFTISASGLNSGSKEDSHSL
jgi:hypothetical protein